MIVRIRSKEYPLLEDAVNYYFDTFLPLDSDYQSLRRKIKNKSCDFTKEEMKNLISIFSSYINYSKIFSNNHISLLQTLNEFGIDIEKGKWG